MKHLLTMMPLLISASVLNSSARETALEPGDMRSVMSVNK
jgi:hypothetical protein